MSGMADEMAARLAADGGAGLPDGGQPGGAAPGSAGDPPDQQPPAAGPSTTEMGADSGNVPDSIPYARFKEVNDRYAALRGFEELQSYGYDADSLRNLAAFETGYLQDPLGTLAQMAEALDLPQEIIDGIRTRADAAGGNGRAGGSESSASGDEQTPALPKEVQERFEYIDQLRERENSAAREAQLQAVVQAWDRMDKADEIETPEYIKLQAISAAAASGVQFRTYDDLATAARKTVMDYRESVLTSAVRTGHGGIPPALPSGAPPAQGPVKFKDLRDANKAVEAAIAAGQLPPIQGA